MLKLISIFCIFSVVVDLSDPTSLESAVMWRQIVLGSASFTDSKSDQTSNEKSEGGKEEETRSKNHKNVEDIPFLLLGNKLDLVGHMCSKLQSVAK